VLAAGAALLADRGGALHTGPRWRLSTSRLALGLLVGGLIVGLGQTLFSSTGLIVSRSRSFFGVLKVSESFRGDPVRDRLVLTHGRTYHGIQLTSQEGRLQPTTYYEEQSGIGRAIRLHPRRAQGLKIGMCGLGVGTVAAYLRPTDQLRIYEIDPSVIALSASPEGVFRYVPEARGPVEVVLGDARVSLEEELVRGGNSYDVLAVDAFSGDAIPVHLLTREALTLYLKHLAPEGVLALHVTNAHLDLVPVVEAVAASLNLSAGLVDTDYDYDDDSVDWDSTWVLVARSAAALAPFGPFDEDEDAPQAPVRPWTDDYSNVVGALRF